MTSVELAQRLVKDFDEKDLSLVTMDTKISLVDAMNSGIQRYYAKCAPYLRVVPSSVYVKDPVSVSVSVTKGESTFTGWTPTNDELYCTITIDGDAIRHQIVGVGELMDTYLGESGTKNATVYYDAIPIFEPIIRVTTNPVIIEDRREIYPVERNQARSGQRFATRSMGKPSFYTVEYNARADLSTATLVLRLDTLPTSAFRLAFDVEMAAETITLNHLLNPINLPVRDDHVTSYLMPMIRDHMTTSSMWRSKDTKSDIQAKAQRAEIELENLTLRNPTPQFNRVGTPVGF